MKNKVIISILLCSLSLFSQTTDFLNAKYAKEYSIIVDESTLLDHPFYSYLDCKKEGYFSVHFIPKSEETRKFWSNYYTESNNQNPDELDARKESFKIKKVINSNGKEYVIFCYWIAKEHLETNGLCSIESIYAKDTAKGKIYLLNPKSGIWEFKEEQSVALLPPYYESSFFINKFPLPFKSKFN